MLNRPGFIFLVVDWKRLIYKIKSVFVEDVGSPEHVPAAAAAGRPAGEAGPGGGSHGALQSSTLSRSKK